MKVILDVSPARMAKALETIFLVQRENPQQKTGTSNGIERNGFIVIRNQGSYTAKSVGMVP